MNAKNKVASSRPTDDELMLMRAEGEGMVLVDAVTAVEEEATRVFKLLKLLSRNLDQLDFAKVGRDVLARAKDKPLQTAAVVLVVSVGTAIVWSRMKTNGISRVVDAIDATAAS